MAVQLIQMSYQLVLLVAIINVAPLLSNVFGRSARAGYLLTFCVDLFAFQYFRLLFKLSVDFRL